MEINSIIFSIIFILTGFLITFIVLLMIHPEFLTDESSKFLYGNAIIYSIAFGFFIGALAFIWRQQIRSTLSLYSIRNPTIAADT